MAFVKKDWQYNDIITEGELNRIEQGIVEANQKADQNTSDLASHLNDNAAHDIPSHFDPTTGHKHTGAAGDGPKLTHDAIDTAKISAFRAHQSTAQSIAINTLTKVAFQTVTYDQLGEYDSANYRFVASKAGLYIVTARIYTEFISTANADSFLRLYKNGSVEAIIGRYMQETTASQRHAIGGSVLVKLNAGDYLEVMYQMSNVSTTLVAGPEATFFSVIRIA